MARRALTLREGRAPVWDRLLTMLFLAGLLHGLIIVGLTFNAAASDNSSAPGLEVLLVSDELPEADKNPTATYLAQRTQTGSGNTRKSVAPRNRAQSVPTLRHAGTAEGSSLSAAALAAGKDQDEQVLSSIAWSTNVRYLAEAGEAGATHEQPLLIDESPAADPGPDDQGPAQLRGPQRDELWITPGYARVRPCAVPRRLAPQGGTHRHACLPEYARAGGEPSQSGRGGSYCRQWQA